MMRLIRLPSGLSGSSIWAAPSSDNARFNVIAVSVRLKLPRGLLSPRERNDSLRLL